MSRSSKKGAYLDANLAKKVANVIASGKRIPIKTWSRRCTIYPNFVGLTFEIHNGKKFVSVYVTEDMVGHKLGEFSPTRTFKQHTLNR